MDSPPSWNHHSIIASANPVGNKWKNSNIITLEDFPLSTQVIQRFDLIFVFKENTNEGHPARFM
jgi:DNA replicative helicase MCM subunit Mcm2 (Cdc46/Mcm family)